jgi:anti-sigma B factor antagonist
MVGEVGVDASCSPPIDGDGVLTLAVAGDLDLNSRDSLRELVTTAIRTEDASRIVVDLAAVTFLDSSAIGVLIGGWRLATEAGKGFGLIRPRGVVRQVLEVTAVWGHLGIEEGPAAGSDSARPDPGPV